METITTDRARCKWYDYIYSLPDSPDERMFHEDLAAMSLGELRREGERLRLRLLVEPRPPHWLLERYQLVMREFTDAQ
jgi:hypothetical protein